MDNNSSVFFSVFFFVNSSCVMFIDKTGFGGGGFFWIYGFLSSARWVVDLFGGFFFTYTYINIRSG